MPSCIKHDEHVWPNRGALTVCSGERSCGYCTGAQRDKLFASAWQLRMHVYNVHCAGGSRADFDRVDLQNFAPAPSHVKRKAAASLLTSGRTRSQSRDGSGKFGKKRSARDSTPQPIERGRKVQRVRSPTRSVSRASVQSSTRSSVNGDTDDEDDAIHSQADDDEIVVMPRPLKPAIKFRLNVPRGTASTAADDGEEEGSDQELLTDEKIPKQVRLDAAYKGRRGGTLVNSEGETREQLKFQVEIEKAREEAACAEEKKARAKTVRLECEMRLAEMNHRHEGTRSEHHVALTHPSKQKKTKDKTKK